MRPQHTMSCFLEQVLGGTEELVPWEGPLPPRTGASKNHGKIRPRGPLLAVSPLTCHEGQEELVTNSVNRWRWLRHFEEMFCLELTLFLFFVNVFWIPVFLRELFFTPDQYCGHKSSVCEINHFWALAIFSSHHLSSYNSHLQIQLTLFQGGQTYLNKHLNLG